MKEALILAISFAFGGAIEVWLRVVNRICNYLRERIVARREASYTVLSSILWVTLFLSGASLFLFCVYYVSNGSKAALGAFAAGAAAAHLVGRLHDTQFAQ